MILRVRGENWAITERLVQDGAVIFRRYDELFPNAPAPEAMLSETQVANRVKHNRVELFTAFLDAAWKFIARQGVGTRRFPDLTGDGASGS